MLLQIARFDSFIVEKYSTLHVCTRACAYTHTHTHYTILSFPFIYWWMLSLLISWLLWTMLLYGHWSAYSFQIKVCIFFTEIPRSRLARLNGSSIFNFLRKLLTVFHSDCDTLRPTNSILVFPFLHILTKTLFFGLLAIAILAGVRWDLIVIWLVFPWWSVMLSIFHVLLHVYVSSLEKCLFRASVHF